MRGLAVVLFVPALAVWAEDALETASDFDTAVPVTTIDEEYQYVYDQVCPMCGGRYEVTEQSLVFDEDGVPYDILHAKCGGCGAERDFYFDVSALPWFSGAWDEE
ncbi:MAG TPA: hypothetical protein ENN88_00770 [Candidatus Coatesbacteria bacterium]|nr:hypothetical protein [Candidatus Coatesbacteria bacterium]